MDDTRDFPTADIASISIGIILCEFFKIPKAAEYLRGHPIWTHQFADKALGADTPLAIAGRAMMTHAQDPLAADMTIKGFIGAIDDIDREVQPGFKKAIAKALSEGER